MLMMESRTTAAEAPKSAEPFLAACGFTGPFGFMQLAGGANNRVFRVTGADGVTLLLKQYFHHPGDRRDRAEAEYAFSTFAWENGVRAIPRPYGCDRDNRLGLYEFISGRAVFPVEISETAVREALRFIQEVNRHKLIPSAKSLPSASEACFSLAQHLGCVEHRLEALRMAEPLSGIDREALVFVEGPLMEMWARVCDRVLQGAQQAGLRSQTELDAEDRCISPSDFGFHNALVTTDNSFRFIDFEYAGWDDPAKLVCDFFCQPALPVPLEYFERVASRVISALSEPDLHLHRIRVLFPVYQIKWCCILLNDFLRLGRDRRRFADGAADEHGRKTRQLEKARWALQRVECA